MALREKLIKDHGAADHKHDQRAFDRRTALAGEVEKALSTAFNRMACAQAAQQRAQAQVKLQEQAVAKAAAAELEAAQVREACQPPYRPAGYPPHIYFADRAALPAGCKRIGPLLAP